MRVVLRGLGIGVGVVAMAAAVGGCGFTDFLGESAYSDQLVSSTGEPITRDQIDAIAGDTTLSNDDRRDAYRDLGIEDEDLIDALIANGGTEGS